MSKWKMVKLGEVGAIITGNTPKTNNLDNYNSDDICFFKPSDIKENKINKLADSEYHVSEKARSEIRVLPPKSVLVTCIGIIGKVGIIEIEACCNQQINAIVPNAEIIDNKFLAYSILRIDKQIQDIANAPVVPIINKTQFSNIEIPLPPLETQQKIADILDKASSLIELRKSQIKKLDLLVKSKFIDMFGDPVTNPMGWEVKKLTEFIEFITSGSRGWSCYFTENGEMFLTIKNVKNSRITLENIQYVNAPETQEAIRTKVQEGDLLISITADLGRTGIVSKEIAEYGAYINQHLSLVRLNKKQANPLFVSFYLESQGGKMQFESKNQVGVKSGLNFDAIKSLAIFAPPIELQAQFAEFVEQVEQQKAVLHQSLEKLETNYKALMQSCFNGEMF